MSAHWLRKVQERNLLIMAIEYYSERRAAVKAGVNRLTLRRHRRAGNITPLVVGGVVLYASNALEDWKARHLSRRGRRENGGE